MTTDEAKKLIGHKLKNDLTVIGVDEFPNIRYKRSVYLVISVSANEIEWRDVAEVSFQEFYENEVIKELENNADYT